MKTELLKEHRVGNVYVSSTRGSLRIMAESDGWLMIRWKGCAPTVVYINDFDKYLYKWGAFINPQKNK